MSGHDSLVPCRFPLGLTRDWMKEYTGENPEFVLEKQLFHSTFSDPLTLGFCVYKGTF